MLVLVIIGSGIWGFVAVAMGVSPLWVGLGAAAIGAVGMGWAFGGKESQNSNRPTTEMTED